MDVPCLRNLGERFEQAGLCGAIDEKNPVALDFTKGKREKQADFYWYLKSGETFSDCSGPEMVGQ